MVDATFNTPYLCRCFDYGVNMTIHSVTKWMGGHGVAIGGVVVDGGNFDWGATDKYPTISEPYAPFNGINLWGRVRTECFRHTDSCRGDARHWTFDESDERVLTAARHRNAFSAYG